MLPSILKDANEVAMIYRQPGVYGKGLAIESLNFGGPDGHVWIQAEKGNDPYKTLPAIFGEEHGELNEMLARLYRASNHIILVISFGVIFFFPSFLSESLIAWHKTS